MSAREIIAGACFDPGACVAARQEGETTDQWRARAAEAALTTAGYRLVPPGQLDRETIEKCAALADEAAKERFAEGDPEGSGVIEDLAAAIRALGAEK